MPTVFDSPDELLSSVGDNLGSSDWITIEQDRINGFADATGDHQWIHVNPEQAASGPFGATIAHGYLTLALTNQFLPEIVRVDGVSMGINYGVNKVRFPQPVVVGSKVRGTAVLADAQEINGGVQAVITSRSRSRSRQAGVHRRVGQPLPAMSSGRPRRRLRYGQAEKEEPNRRRRLAVAASGQPGLLSPTRRVPADIARPPYAVTGDPARRSRRSPAPPTNSPPCDAPVRRRPKSFFAPVRWSDPVSPPTRSTSLFIRRASTPAGIQARSTTAAIRSRCAHRSTRSSARHPRLAAPRRRRHHQYRRDPLHARRHGDTSTTFLVGDVDEPSFRLVKETAGRSISASRSPSWRCGQRDREGDRDPCPSASAWCRA